MAERVIGFRIDIKGSEEVVKNIADLEEIVKSTNAALKEADKGGENYEKLSKQLADSKQQLQQVRKEQRLQIKEAEGINSATGSYRQLNAQLVIARNEFKDLSRADREAAKGENLTKRIQALDKELKELDKTIGQNQRNVGNYASAFEGLGAVFGGTVSDLSSLITGAGGLAVLGTLLASGAQEVKELTDEIFALQGAIEQLTGATGQDLDEYTARITAIARTFDVGTKEVLQSANALTQQLTGDFSKSLDALEEGFIAGANAQGELLDSTKEYAVFIKEAGLDVNQFIKIINQTTKEGLFSDKGIDSVKEAIVALRELPKTAEDALNVIGITGEEVSEVIGEKGLGAAVALVSERLNNFEDDSREVGQVLADIFKGAGEDVGIDFVKSLVTLGMEFEDLEGSATEYAQRQARILELNKELATAQVALTNEISGGTGAYDDAAISLKTNLLENIVLLIKNLKLLLSGFQGIGGAIKAAGDSGTTLGKIFSGLSNIFKASILPFVAIFTVDFPAALAGAGAAVKQFAENASNFFTRVGISFQLTILNFQKALARGNTKEILRRQINLLKVQQIEAAEAGRTVGEAFSTGFEEAVKEREAQKAISDAAATARGEEQAKAAERARAEADRIAKQKEAESERAKEAKKEARKRAKEAKEIEELRAKDSLKDVQELDSKIFESGVELSDKLQEEREKGAEESLKLAEETAEGQLEIIDQRNAAEIQLEKEKRAALFEAAQTAANTAFEIAAIRSDQEFEERERRLKERLEAELEGAAGNEQRQQEIREKFAKEEEALAREQARKDKQRALTQAIINGALAATTTLAQLGLPAAIPALIAVAATTLSEIAIISAQKFQKGGILSGPSHRDGGVPVRVGGSTIVEAEGGEAIINKKSTSKHIGLLDAINRDTGGATLLQDGGVLGSFGLPAIGNLNNNVSSGFAGLINEIRSEVKANTILSLSIRESQLTQRVVLDTEELDTVQATKIELDNLRTLS